MSAVGNSTLGSATSSIRNLGSLLGAFTLGLAWLVPNHYPPWTSFYNNACMAISLLLLVVGQPLGGRMTGPPVVAWIPVCTIVIPWLQWAFGLLLFAGDAWISTLYLLGFAIAIATGYSWSRDCRHLATLIAAATLVAGCVSAVFGLVQVLLGNVLGVWVHDASVGMRAIANLAQPNNLGTLFGFGVVSLLLLREQSFLGKLSSACVLTLLISGAVLTQSRTALLFGPIICCAVYFFSTKVRVLKTKPRTTLVITLLHWLGTWGWPSAEKMLLITPVHSLVERATQNVRLQAWQMLLGAVSQSPWEGWGWLQTGAAQFAVADRYSPVGELFSEAHNLFLELVVWCGYPVGITLSACIVYWFVTRFWRLSSIEALCGWLTVAILGVHSMVELPYLYAYFLLPAGLWIGIVECSTDARHTLSFRWTLGLSTIATILLFLICGEYWVVEEDFRLARFEYLKIGSIHAPQLAPDAVLLSNLTEYARFYRTVPSPGMDHAQLEAMFAITKRYPYAKLLYGYAEALVLNGNLAKAEQVFVKIRRIHGERVYRVLKADMEERATQQPTLMALVRSLPK